MSRTDQEKDLVVRSIRLPAYVWQALDDDAQRCRRSPVRQLEALLVRYYDLDSNIDIDERTLTETFEAVSRVRRSKSAK